MTIPLMGPGPHLTGHGRSTLPAEVRECQAARFETDASASAKVIGNADPGKIVGPVYNSIIQVPGFWIPA